VIQKDPVAFFAIFIDNSKQDNNGKSRGTMGRNGIFIILSSPTKLSLASFVVIRKLNFQFTISNSTLSQKAKDKANKLD
jgi:hypothetical protein